MLAGIELGGTKIVVATAAAPDEPLLARTSIPSGDDPHRALASVCAWIHAHGGDEVTRIGIASFGPVDLHPYSSTFGCITATPKPGWANTDVVGTIARTFPSTRIGFDTDVNAACLAEWWYGAARGTRVALYITMGTGIGGGIVIDRRPARGLVHPEMGHIHIPAAAAVAGVCPYHGDCWEGRCSGPAIEARAGAPAETLPAEHPAWSDVIDETAVALANLVCTISPERIVLGGSVPKAGQLGSAEFFARTRRALLATLNHYIVDPALTPTGVDTFLVPPQFGDDAGVRGALTLAATAK
jgi:fructokinase